MSAFARPAGTPPSGEHPGRDGVVRPALCGRGAVLERVRACLPGTELSGPALRAYTGLAEQRMKMYTRFLGFSSVRVADGARLPDMLLEATRATLAGVDPQTVRYLLYAHTTQQVAPLGVNLADRLRRTLGLHRASVFSVSQQNCASGLFALDLAATLLAGEPPAARALVVTGECGFTELLRHIPGIALIGDGAAAALLGRRDDHPIGDTVLGSHFVTRGRFYRGVGLGPDDEREYHQTYAPVFCEVIRTAVGSAGLDLDDVAMVVPHNVNRLSWKSVAKGLGLPMERVYLDALPRIGHLQAGDPLVNLAALKAAGRLKPGDRYVLAAVGLGATFGAVVLQAGDLGD
ncbi:3-oxoacyl-[acyl-carrier-protein] synthase III C-terminal domain-containing protein [Microbispora sp. CA-135349]|uniref:3-oxoacyl-[acyl-carrier-protein] synthase III C-terminal domain-containing protein n=1 Tax=Microbispora sp. CA-135349 TaxID=3239953 RepID=UPI003D9139A5